MKIIENFSDSKGVSSNSEDFIKLYKPSTGEEYAHVPKTTRDEFEKIINKMKLAQPLWANTPITKRSEILFKFDLTILLRVDTFFPKMEVIMDDLRRNWSYKPYIV